MTLNEVLERAMVGNTQMRLAKSCGVSQMTISKWLRGEIPSELAVSRAARGLGMRVGEFRKIVGEARREHAAQRSAQGAA